MLIPEVPLCGSNFLLTYYSEHKMFDMSWGASGTRRLATPHEV